MEAEVLESTPGKLVLKFKPFDHGVLNLVKHELWNDSATQMAGFKVTHPEIGYAKFVLKTKGKAPKAAWNSALKKAVTHVSSLGAEFKKLK